MWFRRKKDTVEDRVSKGIALLDQKAPGWHRQIRLGRLDISNGFSCALGQTYLSYFEGKRILGLSNQEVITHGFQAQARIRDSVDAEFEELTAEWRRQIEARLDTERAAWQKQIQVNR